MSEEVKQKSPKSKKIRIAVIVIVTVLVGFVLLFFLYKSPAKYVKNGSGEIYVYPSTAGELAGQQYVYYTDLFGNEFTIENGIRSYHAVPAVIEDEESFTFAAEETAAEEAAA